MEIGREQWFSLESSRISLLSVRIKTSALTQCLNWWAVKKVFFVWCFLFFFGIEIASKGEGGKLRSVKKVLVFSLDASPIFGKLLKYISERE